MVGAVHRTVNQTEFPYIIAGFARERGRPYRLLRADVIGQNHWRIHKIRLSEVFLSSQTVSATSGRIARSRGHTAHQKEKDEWRLPTYAPTVGALPITNEWPQSTGYRSVTEGTTDLLSLLPETKEVPVLRRQDRLQV